MVFSKYPFPGCEFFVFFTLELATRVQSVIDKKKEKKETTDKRRHTTPGTAVQPSREPGKPARRRRLVMPDDVKKETPGTEIKE